MRILIALAMVALAACDSEPDADQASETTGSKAADKRPAKPEKLPFAWPPVMAEPYPDYELIDQTGQRTRISQFRGKVVLVEIIGMDCPACQAFAGAADKGGFEGGRPQAGLKSIHECARRFAGVDLPDPRVVYIQLLLYDMKRRAAPTPAAGAAWAKHFGMDRAKEMVVLVGTAAWINPASFKMIPGFHLVDTEGVLRGDSTGHHPKENLYREFLPRMGQLIAAMK